MMANVTQAAVVFTGTLPDAPALNLIAPSSVEQKLRTPVKLKLTGEAADTKDWLAPPEGSSPVARNT